MKHMGSKTTLIDGIRVIDRVYKRGARWYVRSTFGGCLETFAEVNKHEGRRLAATCRPV